MAETIGFDPAGRFPAALVWVPVAEPLRPWLTPDYVSDGAGGVAPPSVAYLVDQLLAALEERRWRAEVGGCTAPDGTRLATSDRAKTMLLGAYERSRLRAEAGVGATILWKRGRGDFLDLPVTTVMSWGAAVIDHVQACIDREGALTAAIQAAATEGWPAAIEAFRAGIDQGWPGGA